MSVESKQDERDNLERPFHPSPGDTRMFFFFKVLAILGPFKFHINFTMRFSSSAKNKMKRNNTPNGILIRIIDELGEI